MMPNRSASGCGLVGYSGEYPLMMVRGSNNEEDLCQWEPAAAPGAPAWPAALGIAATIAGWCEDSVNAGRGRTDCGAAAMRGHPSDRTPEDRAGVRDPAPRRAAPARRKRGLRGRRTRADAA